VGRHLGNVVGGDSAFNERVRFWAREFLRRRTLEADDIKALLPVCPAGDLILDLTDGRPASQIRLKSQFERPLDDQSTQARRYARRMNADGFTLTVTRELPAPRTVVFRAFVDPNEFAEWFGQHGYTVSQIQFTPQVGEHYRIEMQPSDGKHFHVTGEVREIDPPSRLCFTFVYEQPNPDDVETEVSLSFDDHGESTRVDLTQGPFKTEPRRSLHQDGWNESFDKLERFITAHA